MKLEDIHDEWSKDCTIDILNLVNESAKIGPLHSKYWKILTTEKIRLKKYQNDYEKLFEEKFYFVTSGDDEYSRERGWVLPPKGRLVVKEEAKRYVSIGEDITNLSLKIVTVQEKINLLESIIKTISSRSFAISNIIKWTMFQNGEN